MRQKLALGIDRGKVFTKVLLDWQFSRKSRFKIFDGFDANFDCDFTVALLGLRRSFSHSMRNVTKLVSMFS